MFENFVYENCLGKIEKDKSFKDITTIKAGGKIKYLYYPKDISSLMKAYEYIIKNNLKYNIIGNGSNVLGFDDEYQGIIIYLKSLNEEYKIIDDKIFVTAFISSTKLASIFSKEGITTFKSLIGIPGLLGGAIYNNCGNQYGAISDNLLDVTYIDSHGNLIVRRRDELDFSYRHSTFHNFEGIIIGANFRVIKGEIDEDVYKRILNDRKLAQPIENPNMGSIFKNNRLFPAWRVIDSLNMRGYELNGAAVSMKHANFIINMKDAKSKDIFLLINLIKEKALNELGVLLEEEIKYIY